MNYHLVQLEAWKLGGRDAYLGKAEEARSSVLKRGEFPELWRNKSKGT